MNPGFLVEVGYWKVMLNLMENILVISVTRGPRGPWVAHLRKRSKVTVEPFTEDH